MNHPSDPAAHRQAPPPIRWSDAAACRDTPVALFYSELETDVARALTLCAHCQVQPLCLAWAIEQRESHGVWGGTTEQQRRRTFRSEGRGRRSVA